MHLVHPRPVCVAVTLDDAIWKLRREGVMRASHNRRDVNVNTGRIKVRGGRRIWRGVEAQEAKEREREVYVIWSCEWHDTGRNTSSLFLWKPRAQLGQHPQTRERVSQAPVQFTNLTWFGIFKQTPTRKHCPSGCSKIMSISLTALCVFTELFPTVCFWKMFCKATVIFWSRPSIHPVPVCAELGGRSPRMI